MTYQLLVFWLLLAVLACACFTIYRWLSRPERPTPLDEHYNQLERE